MDKMFIRDLELSCIIGTRPVERRRKQKVILSIELDCDLRPAGRTDQLKDAVNYYELCNEITRLVEGSRFLLLEKLATEAADLCLRDRRIHAAKVTLDKPAALKRARSAAVQLLRTRARS